MQHNRYHSSSFIFSKELIVTVLNNFHRKSESLTASAVLFNAVETAGVIQLSALRVRQNFVRVADFFELKCHKLHQVYDGGGRNRTALLFILLVSSVELEFLR